METQTQEDFHKAIKEVEPKRWHLVITLLIWFISWAAVAYFIM